MRGFIIYGVIFFGGMIFREACVKYRQYKDRKTDEKIAEAVKKEKMAHQEECRSYEMKIFMMQNEPSRLERVRG